MAIQDLSDPRDPAASGRQDRDPDKGWAELMRLASAFPLEMLSFGGTTASVRLPRPRAVSYDAAIDIADGAGLSLATW